MNSINKSDVSMSLSFNLLKNNSAYWLKIRESAHIFAPGVSLRRPIFLKYCEL